MSYLVGISNIYTTTIFFTCGTRLRCIIGWKMFRQKTTTTGDHLKKTNEKKSFARILADPVSVDLRVNRISAT